MALGEKYRIHVDHQFGGDSRYFQVFLEGYGGSVVELTGGAIPVSSRVDVNILIPNVLPKNLQALLFFLTVIPG